MSRITGVVARVPGFPLSGTLDGLLAAVRSGPLGDSSRLGDALAALGCAGERAAALACRGDTLVVLDGWLYNRGELGQSLDAEILLELYARHGFEGALSQCNGDFAIALWDGSAGTLWLARDRFGVRPLYYAVNQERLAFASRPRGLLALPGVSRRVNRQYTALVAASHYRTFDNDPAASPYRDVAQLPAAHALRFDTAAGTTTVSRYWTLEGRSEVERPEAELAERYRHLLLDAVALRVRTVRSAGATAAFTLSGGLDSSSVLACARRELGAPQDAFSTVYQDATYDESAEIQSMLGSNVARWHTVRVGDVDLEPLVARMIEANDEPVATATWLSHFLLCEAARRAGFDVLFGGLGGDELNAGEYEYFFSFFADLRARGDARLDAEVRAWIAHHDHPVFRKSHEVMERGLARWTDPAVAGRCLPDRDRIERYARALAPGYFDLKAFRPVMDHPFRSYLRNRAYQDLYRETTPCCLRAADRHGAAFGVQPVWPFLDHRLAELMFEVDGTLKIREGVTKHLLREAMRGILPEETRARVKKTGWNAPAHVWFSGKGRELLLDLVASRPFRERGLYDQAAVRALIDEHDAIVTSGRPAENHMMFLWQLLNLELWFRSSLAPVP